MFTNSHANTPLGQSERAYHFSYFINMLKNMFICLLFCEVSLAPVWVDRYRKELCRDCCCLSPNEGLARGTRVKGGDFLSVFTFRSLLVFVVFFFSLWQQRLENRSSTCRDIRASRLEWWFWGRLEPRYDEGPKDWQNVFAMTRLRYMEGLFSYILLFLGRENRLVEVRYERFLCNCHIEEYEGILLTSRNDQIEFTVG